MRGSTSDFLRLLNLTAIPVDGGMLQMIVHSLNDEIDQAYSEESDESKQKKAATEVRTYMDAESPRFCRVELSSSAYSPYTPGVGTW